MILSLQALVGFEIPHGHGMQALEHRKAGTHLFCEGNGAIQIYLVLCKQISQHARADRNSSPSLMRQPGLPAQVPSYQSMSDFRNRPHGSDVSWISTCRSHTIRKIATLSKYDPCRPPTGAVG